MGIVICDIEEADKKNKENGFEFITVERFQDSSVSVSSISYVSFQVSRALLFVLSLPTLDIYTWAEPKLNFNVDWAIYL